MKFVGRAYEPIGCYAPVNWVVLLALPSTPSCLRFHNQIHVLSTSCVTRKTCCAWTRPEMHTNPDFRSSCLRNISIEPQARKTEIEKSAGVYCKLWSFHCDDKKDGTIWLAWCVLSFRDVTQRNGTKAIWQFGDQHFWLLEWCNSWVAIDVIAAMLVGDNKRFLISFDVFVIWFSRDGLIASQE